MSEKTRPIPVGRGRAGRAVTPACPSRGHRRPAVSHQAQVQLEPVALRHLQQAAADSGQKETRELNFPNAISGFSRDSSVVRASLGFGTLTLEGITLGRTEVVILGNRQEKQTIQITVVDPKEGAIRVDLAKHDNKAPTPKPPTAAPDLPLKKNPPLETAPKVTAARPTGVQPAPVEQATLAVPPDLPKRVPVAKPSAPPGESGISKDGELTGYKIDARPALTVPAGDSVKMVELTAVAVPVDQVSAAYSLDPLVAEAQMDGDHVRIWGRSPGQAVVVLVHQDFSTTTVHVAVMQAPPILPDGLWSGVNPGEAQGYYEGRVSSDPMEVSQVFDYRTVRTHLHIANAILPGGNLPGVSTTWFPFSFFRFSAERWKLTLVDERVNSSPISVNSTVLRGIHFATGGLSVHAGYTSVAGFESLFLPVHKQLIAGASVAEPLGGDYQLGVTGYYIEHDAFALDPRGSSTVGTLFFRKRAPVRAPQRAAFAAEIGSSGGVGGALSADRITHAHQFQLAARYRPRQYAMPDIDNLAGLQSSARWNHYWSKRFASDFSGSANHLFTRPGAKLPKSRSRICDLSRRRKWS